MDSSFLEFNLIATCPRNREFEAVNELEQILFDLGDEKAKAWESEVKGLILACTNFGPFEAIEKIRKYIKEGPWRVRVLKRIIPIEFVVKTDLEIISKLCREKISSRISPSETFRITLEKRHTDLSSREIIDAAAKQINAKVDLENPQKIILIEVVGNATGISLLKSEDQILNVTKELLREG